MLERAKNPRCKNPSCRKRFERATPWEIACSSECLDAVAKLALEASRAKRNREQRAARLKLRRELREGRERLKSRKDRVKEAQRAFNAYCRERDYLLPCVSCGTTEVTEQNGGGWDCGHFRTIGAAPELRFEPLNVAKQCKHCNSGVIRSGRNVRAVHDPERAMSIRARFRDELLRRIGPEAVEWLEGPHEPKHYSADDLIAIRKSYQVKLRELRQAREMGHEVAAA